MLKRTRTQRQIVPIERLAAVIGTWLEEIRTGSGISSALEDGRQLVQIWQRDDALDLANALDRWLAEGCEQLGEASADLLTAYYWQAQSVQAIKNNHRRPESVATLWRRVKDGVGQLCESLHQAEIAARAVWQQNIRNRLPYQSEVTLFGRSHAITTLTQELCDRNHHLFNLIGVGGLGKTALTFATVEHLIDEWYVRDVLWVTVEQKAITTALLLDIITAQLYLHLTGITPEQIGYQQRVHHLQPLLAERPLLIVVDNIERISDDDGTLAAKLYELNSRILLVSRTAIMVDQPLGKGRQAMRALPLAELTLAATRDFVRDRADKLNIPPPPDDSFEPLYRVIGGHPLALRLFVQLGRYFSAAEIIAEFETADVRDIDALYTSIYERVYQHQSPHAQQLLDALLLAPTSGVTRDYLAAYSGLDKRQLWDAIQALHDAALLERFPNADPPRYRIHSLTAAYLASRPTSRDWQAAQRQAACAYWQAQSESADTTFLTTHNAALLQLVEVGLRHADSWLATADLLLALYFPIHNSFHWAEWLPQFQRALDHAQDDQRPTQYRLYSRLATLHHHTGDYAKAAKMHHHALDLAQSLNDLKGVGRENVHLCIAYRYIHSYADAAEHGQTALDIFEELNLHPHFHVVALNSLGQNAFESTNFEGANRLFAKAIESSENKVPDDTMSLIYVNWVNTLRLMGRYQEAFDKSQKAEELVQRSGADLSRILLDYLLCNLYLDQGLISEAEQIILKAPFDATRSNLPPLHAAHIAEVKGRYYLHQKWFPQAIIHLKQAILYWEITSYESQLGLSIILLAKAYLEIGDVEQANQMQQKAAILFKKESLSNWHSVFVQHYKKYSIS